jgi:hypothetical protein
MQIPYAEANDMTGKLIILRCYGRPRLEGGAGKAIGHPLELLQDSTQSVCGARRSVP